MVLNLGLIQHSYVGHTHDCQALGCSPSCTDGHILESFHLGNVKLQILTFLCNEIEHFFLTMSFLGQNILF